MAATLDAETLRRKSLRYLWMHNRDWVRMAEDGDPLIVVEGDGVRVTDSYGRSWIDVNGGYNSVNVGYGRQEIVEAAYEQMANLGRAHKTRNRTTHRFEGGLEDSHLIDFLHTDLGDPHADRDVPNLLSKCFA